MTGEKMNGRKNNVAQVALGSVLALMAGAALAQEPACAMTGLQKAAGYVTLANTVKFLSAVGVSVFLGVFLWQLRSVFKAVPLAAWKAAGYGMVGALCASALWVEADSARYLQFAGAALGCGAWAILLGDVADMMGLKKDGSAALTGGAAALSGALALATGNDLVGAVSVASFMGFLGFGLMSPSLWVTGKDEGPLFALDRAAVGACATLGVAAAWKISQGSMGSFEVFWPGVAWLATLTAGLALLARSSSWVRSGLGSYVARNVVFLAFAGVAVWIGAHEGMHAVSQVAGTCALIWIVAKPWDIPKKGLLAYSFFGAVTCGAVFEITRQAVAHPELWGKFLMF
jgi:hypothetical protein